MPAARALYGLAGVRTGRALQCDHCLGFHFFTVLPTFALDHDAAVGGDARLVLDRLSSSYCASASESAT